MDPDLVLRKLALEPESVETVPPKRTRCIRSRMGALVRWAFSRGTVYAVARIDARGIDTLGVVGLRVGPTAKGTARALGTALIGMVTPPLATSAADRAGVGFGAFDLAIHSANRDEL